MNFQLLRILSVALCVLEVAPFVAVAEETPPASPATIGVARANAANINLALQAQERLNALPDDVKRDLLEKMEVEKNRLQSEQKQAAQLLKSHPTKTTQIRLNSIISKFSALADDSLFLTQSIVEPATPPPPPAPPPIAPAPAVNPAPAISYKLEVLLPTLNPTFAMCGDGVWTSPKFPYQAQIDKNTRSLKQISLAVGLFKAYTQKNKPGLPGLPDLILPAAGTGIAVGTNLVLTNQHVVANMVVDANAPPSAWQLNSVQQRFIIWFPVETSACAAAAKSAAFEVVQIVYAGLGPSFDDDIAVVKVQPLDGGTLYPVTFAETASYSGKQYLGVVGYPDRPDPADYVPPTGNGLFQNDALLDAYFDLPNNQQPKYQVERFGFGTLVDLNDPEARIIGHDAPTDNSSSGSLIVSLETGMPIALHAGGNLGAGIKSGVNIAYRSDYIVGQLRQHGILSQQ